VKEKSHTAIGSQFGANYACHFVVAREQLLLDETEKNHLILGHSVDDIWGIWTHGRILFKEFRTLSPKISEFTWYFRRPIYISSVLIFAQVEGR